MHYGDNSMDINKIIKKGPLEQPATDNFPSEFRNPIRPENSQFSPALEPKGAMI